MTDDPLVVYGPANLEYDFGPHHPLTPRRFPPSIDLLRDGRRGAHRAAARGHRR